MTILDTSIIVPLVRSRGTEIAQRLAEEIGDADVFLTSITELELLQGARDEAEWRKLERYLAGQDIIVPPPIVWRTASRTYFELRKMGLTVRSSFDCLIAEITITQNMTLLHNDADFTTIATIRPLKHIRLDLDTPAP